MACIVGRGQKHAVDYPVKRRLIPKSGGSCVNVWGGYKFSMMTYNILAQLLVRRDIYGYCSQKALKVRHRRATILKEIIQAHCDIICLQEVDEYHIYWALKLNDVGYDSVFVQKDKFKHAGKSHGCAIFWKREKFEKVKYQEIDFREISEEYEDDDVYDELDRKNVCHFVALRPRNFSTLRFGVPKPRNRTRATQNGHTQTSGASKSNCTRTGSRRSASSRPDAKEDPEFVSDGFGIVVSNTHLFWNPKYGFVKLKQCEKLMTEILKFNEDLNYDMVIAGDFNTVPNNIIHKYLTCVETIPETDLTMFLTPKDHGSRDAFRLSKLRGITNEDIRKNHTDINLEKNQIRLKEVRSILRTAANEFPRLRSVYEDYTKLIPESERDPENPEWSGEPPFTNYTKDWKGTVDYLFVPVEEQSTVCKLKCTHLLSLPRESELNTHTALPNELFGSDHLSLVCHFQLSKK